MDVGIDAGATRRRRILPAALVAAALALVSCSDRTPGDAGAADPASRATAGSPGSAAPAASAPAPPTTASPPSAPPTSPPPAPPADPVRPPAVADDAAGLAAQLTAAERAVRDPATAPADLAAAAHLQQAAYRALAARPEWDAHVLAAVPAELRRVVEANVVAGRELRALVRRPGDTLPAWHVVPAAPAADLLAHYREAEAATGVPWPYLAAINLTETRMGRIDGVSSAGAQGPMQFLPSTWAAYGEGDVHDDRDAILAAARYLRAHGAPEDMATALHRYNPTPRYVEAVRRYAEVMLDDERAYLGYHHWQVYFATSLGDVLLPVGYRADERRPVAPEEAAAGAARV